MRDDLISLTLTLEDFFKKSSLKKETTNPLILIGTILHRSKRGLNKIKLAKVYGAITVEYGDREQKENVQIYSYGPYPLGFENTLKLLTKKGYVAIEGNKVVLTDAGILWIEGKISELQKIDKSSLQEIFRSIDEFLVMTTNELIEWILTNHPEFRSHYKKFTISGKNLYLLFDWSEYGENPLKVKPYHYTLLRSFARVEKRIKCNPPNLAENEIKSEIRSDQLVKQRRKSKIVPLTKIFEKSNPPYITQNKIESKNYIHNLWYIVEAINIIHALAQIKPTIGEIAQVCLTDYRGALESEEKSKEELKKMRESMIRNELNKLWEEGIISREKIKAKYRYKLVAYSIYDVLLDRKFSVLNHSIIRRIYQEKIKQEVDSM